MFSCMHVLGVFEMELIFSHSCPHSVVFCSGTSKAVDNTPLLSSAHTAARLSPQHSFTRMLGVGKILQVDIPRTGDPN